MKPSDLPPETQSHPAEPASEALKRGTLYVVGTPIGNLSDLTFRALEVLKHADLIACEDTRQTLKLLNRFGISKPLHSLFGPKEKRDASRIAEQISNGKIVALVTDAGTPGVSDPGHFLVRHVREKGLRVEAVPGVSAVTYAVSVSGLCEDGFIFLGFLHRRTGRMRKELQRASELGLPLVFFESPYRIVETLKTAVEALGGDRTCWVGRELTKKFEEHFSGPLLEVAATLAERKVLGEVTAVISGEAGRAPDEELD
jgi:16S rRNA (cytidine1402-2'-O)-methyltransferase